MRSKKILASLALLPVILSGCASSGSGDTPFFPNGDRSATAIATAPPLEDGDTKKSDPSKKGDPSTETKESKKPKDSDSTTNSDSKGNSGKDQQVKNPDGTTKIDFAKEYAKEKGLKLDANGNPYQEVSTSDDAITSVTRPKDSADLEEEANRLKASPEQQQAGVDAINSMINAAKAEDWKKACKFVYLSKENSNADCIDKMKRSYSNGVKFTKFTRGNVESLAKNKDSLSISLKGKTYEDSQRTAFTRDDGVWKILFM